MGILVTILVVLAVIALVSWTVGFLFHLAVSAIFWAAAGYIAVRVMGGDPSKNWLHIIVLGLIGGFIGSIILRALSLQGLENIWLIGSIISGSIGAVVLIATVRLVGDKNFAKYTTRHFRPLEITLHALLLSPLSSMERGPGGEVQPCPSLITSFTSSFHFPSFLQAASSVFG